MSSSTNTTKSHDKPISERVAKFRARMLDETTTSDRLQPGSSSHPSILEQLRVKIQEDEEQKRIRDAQAQLQNIGIGYTAEIETLRAEVAKLREEKRHLEDYKQRLQEEIREVENGGKKMVCGFLQEMLDRLCSDI